MFMRSVYDEGLAQAAYIIGCQKTGEAIVIDPERDVDRYINIAKDNGLKITAVAETHIHADFVSGARELTDRVNATAYLSAEGGEDWNSRWVEQGDVPHVLLKDNDTFNVGNIRFRAVHTPGHTPEHLMYEITDTGGGADEPIAIATGDFLFVGDLGRPDLLETAAGQSGAMQEGAERLQESTASLETMQDFVQVWPGHGAGSACGKALGAVPSSTVGYERRFNTALRAAGERDSFVSFILSGQPEPPLYFARMKSINRDGPKVLGKLPDPPSLSSQDLGAIDTQQVAIIDTRAWPEFRDGHLPGSLSFPITEKSFNTDAGSMVPHEQDIVLICQQHQIDDIVRKLVRVGLDHVVGWAAPADLEGLNLAQTQEVDVTKANAMLKAGSHGLLDVRKASEFAEGHIQNAQNRTHTRLAAHLNEVPKDAPLLVNCRSGKRSARACALLERHGYRATNIAGGILAWSEQFETVQ